MKWLIFLFLIPATGAMADPGDPDTVRVVSAAAYVGQEINLPVYFFNDEPLSAVEVVFSFDSTRINLDSVSLAGSRLEYIPVEDIVFRDSATLLNLWVPDMQGFIPPGNGLMCRFYFTLTEAVAGDILVIDTATWPLEGPGVKTTIFADEFAACIYPEFVGGEISVIDCCGDATGDGQVNILDIVYLINYKYKDGEAPDPFDNCDVNNDGFINILDIIVLINYKYKNGSAPQCS